ncbi:hypothetical protein [Longimicrobium terrae]|uniref:Thioredoxin domain-containing protein n=1 Tax=Longimicrobium terrae TaxID=1639882 RepID=A0A841H0S8_9BACT|nr:hypothetical protein [Longimicrobium terrae]MBB4637297.1 hypothetical protein [Longimicrobium terrae]MBB6071695.1 hypothetical protein [Longimicrobium terrae]NNC28456.1 hypothetical protein [Longimicrobium terrae]
MNRWKRLSITGFLALLLAWSGLRTASAAVAWSRAPEAAQRTGLLQPARTRVRATTPELARIARAKRAIVFVYAPTCSACNGNMANWIDLVADLHGGQVQLFAVAPAGTPAAREYWGPLSRHVHVITATPAEVRGALNAEVTPATILVENGVIRGVATGALTRPAIRQVHAFAARPAE